jgi:hypothetical protein
VQALQECNVETKPCQLQLYKHVALCWSHALHIRCVRRAFSASELTRLCCSAMWIEIVVDDLVPCCTDFPKQAHRRISQFVLLSQIALIGLMCSSRTPRMHTLGKHEMSRNLIAHAGCTAPAGRQTCRHQHNL